MTNHVTIEQAFEICRPLQYEVNNMTKIKLVEKANNLAVHGLFDSMERAEDHLKNVIPEYCSRGYFMDKTLTPESFEIING